MSKKNNGALAGVEIGEHGFHLEKLTEEIKERLIANGYNFTTLNTSRIKWSEEEHLDELVKAAELLGENKIYFFLMRIAQKYPKDMDDAIITELMAKIKDAAGEYFLGDCVTETGLAYSAKGERFFSDKYSPNFVFDNVKDAHDKFIDTVSSFVKRNELCKIPQSASIESTMLTKYNVEAGITHQMLEAPNADADMLYPSIRGAAKNLKNSDDKWDVLIAHEWYGGMRHDDALKIKRLDLVSKFSYISGARGIILESGDDFVSSYGIRFEHDSVVSESYRKALKTIKKLTENDDRPSLSPKVKFGIISGLYDGYAAFSNSSVWAQYGRREWAHGEAEFSYRLLSSLANKERWCEVTNYGEEDLSTLPAYGTYDIVPIESDVDALSNYEYLVFLGWNTMTDENMDKLTEYVRRGGKLLLSGAHLNYSVKREGEYIPPSEEKLEKLIGARYTGEDFTSNYGSKFTYNTLNQNNRYPASVSFGCDPLFSAGALNYMKLELTSANELAHIENTWVKGDNLGTTVIENKIGDGTVTFVTSKNYPGNPALTPLYSMLMREFVKASARAADIKVIASDRLRYTVYEGNKIYLLNTDFDLPITVKIIYGEKEQLITLDSLELKGIQL